MLTLCNQCFTTKALLSSYSSIYPSRSEIHWIVLVDIQNKVLLPPKTKMINRKGQGNEESYLEERENTHIVVGYVVNISLIEKHVNNHSLEITIILVPFEFI